MQSKGTMGPVAMRSWRWTFGAMVLSGLRMFGAVAVSAAVCACGPSRANATGSGEVVTLAAAGPVGSDTGAVGFELSLQTGQQIPVLSWTISGPNGAATVVKNGTLPSESAGVTFLVGNLPVASGYQISLGGTANDGSIVCVGSAPFDVANRVTTPVVIDLACSTATQGAHVTLVNGTSFNCAAWSNVSASPTETTVGGTVTLSATAAGPIPGNITYDWSAPSGTFGNASTASSSFTCTQVGPVSVTLVVGDGPVPAGSSCNASLDTRTFVIQCDAAMQADAGGGQPDGGGPDGGGNGPPPAAPALPVWATGALAGALLALGALASRRRSAT